MSGVVYGRPTAVHANRVVLRGKKLFGTGGGVVQIKTFGHHSFLTGEFRFADGIKERNREYKLLSEHGKTSTKVQIW
jgi:hypothetical protein